MREVTPGILCCCFTSTSLLLTRVSLSCLLTVAHCLLLGIHSSSNKYLNTFYVPGSRGSKTHEELAEPCHMSKDLTIQPTPVPPQVCPSHYEVSYFPRCSARNWALLGVSLFLHPCSQFTTEAQQCSLSSPHPPPPRTGIPAPSLLPRPQGLPPEQSR